MHSQEVVGQVRREALELARSGEVLDTVARDVCRHLVEFFGRNRRIPGGELRGMLRGIHDLVVSELAPVRLRIDVRHPTAARPKSEAYEMLYVVTLPEARYSDGKPDLFRLTSLRIHATRKKVIFTIMPTALVMREHAAMRLVERGGDISRVVRSLSQCMSEWAALPDLAENALTSNAFDRLAIPGCDGLLMGYIDPRAAIPSGVEHVFGNGVWTTEKPPVDPGRTPATFMVNTYIGPDEIHDHQLEQMEVIDEWRLDNIADFQRACDDILWPNRTLPPDEAHGMDDELLEEIVDLMSSPRMLKAMGNEKSYVRRYGAAEEPEADAPSIAFR